MFFSPGIVVSSHNKCLSLYCQERALLGCHNLYFSCRVLIKVDLTETDSVRNDVSRITIEL